MRTTLPTASLFLGALSGTALSALAQVQAQPATPAIAKMVAQRHFTQPAFVWSTRLPSALVATATALVPIATWAR
nr:hypothetical protein [Aureimonas sp. D3]